MNESNIIHIQKRTNFFVQVDKRPLEDPRLSFKAKGLLAYLLSRPADWQVRFSDLCNRSTEGESSIRAGMTELKKYGYAKLQVLRSLDLKHSVGTRWTIYELPELNPEVAKIDTSEGEPRGSENLKLRKSSHTNNEWKNKNENSVRSADQGSHPSGLLGEEAPYDKFIQKSSDKLENFVRAKHRISPTYNKERWYNEMRLLLQDIKGDRERLVRVLRTYIEEEHSDYTPLADSARSFRKKFLTIERWAVKANPEGAREPKIICIDR